MKKIGQRAASCLLVILACVLLLIRVIFDLIIKLMIMIRHGYIKGMMWLLNILKSNKHDKIKWHDSVYDAVIDSVSNKHKTYEIIEE